MEKLQHSYLYYYVITIWDWVANLGVAIAPQDQRERIKATNVSVVTYTLYGLVFSLVYAMFGAWNLILVTNLCCLCVPVILILNATGRFRAARISQSVSFALAICVVDCAIGVQSGIEVLFFPAIASIFINFSYAEKRDLNYAFLFAAAVTIGSRFLTAAFPPIIPLPLSWMPFVSASAWLGSIAIFLTQISTLFRSYEKSKREVVRSHATTRAVLESVKDGFYYVDRSWIIQYYNPQAAAFLESFGIKNAQGMSFWSLIPEENDQVYVHKLKIAMETNVQYREEFFDTVNGKWSEVIAYPSAEGMSITYRDVQDRKLAEIALRESEQLQRAIFDQAATGLNILSPDGVFLRANAEMCRFLGLTESELIGKRVSDLTFDDDQERSRQDIGKLMRGEVSTLTKQKSYKHKSGRAIPANLQVRLLLDDAGKPKFMVSSVQDLSESKAAEHKLIQASKMSSLGEMAGSVAHEINSPMAVIQLSAEQLEDREIVELMDADDIVMIATRITDTVSRISRIIRGLKNFSRNAEHDAMASVRLATIIEESLELCRERFKSKNVEIRLAEIPDVNLLCRPTELCQVLLNLLSNAFDAIDEKSTGERWVEISGAFLFSRIQLNVTDSGPGIPDSVADRMHEAFFTTKPLGKGTGLGLSISKGIIENHGGQIFLDRGFKNTRFVVDLPATVSGSSAILPAASAPIKIGKAA